MNGVHEHRIGALILRIDRSLCVGFGDCVTQAPAALALDDNDVVVLSRTDTADADSLVAACDACPVDALSIVDTAGREILRSSVRSAPRQT